MDQTSRNTFKVIFVLSVRLIDDLQTVFPDLPHLPSFQEIVRASSAALFWKYMRWQSVQIASAFGDPFGLLFSPKFPSKTIKVRLGVSSGSLAPLWF